jgi:anti-sigma-K factor RskA
MTDEGDIDMLAAEYVLGTLPADERTAVALRSRHDKPLAAAIAAWEARLSPLAEAIAPREVPSHLWARIEQRLDSLGEVPEAFSIGAIVTAMGLEQRMRRWRATAIATSALAASLLLVVGYREMTRPEPEKSFVAVLQKDAQSPAFLVSVDLEQKLLTIRAVAAPPQPGKSYELWLVHDDLKTPRSLGVIGTGPFTVVQPKLAAYAPQTIEQATLAVSLEPEGGSPTGAPTGPVLYAGKLIQATE